MKSVILLLIALALLLVGCPKDTETEPAPKEDAATVAKTVDAGSDSDVSTTVTTTAKTSDAGTSAD